MENKVVKNNDVAVIRLLPNYCKKIGLGLIAFVIVFFICLLIIHPSFAADKRDILKYFIFLVFVAGLVIISISKDKIEDELTMMLRLKAMAIAFLSGVCVGVIYPFSFLLISGNAISIKSGYLILGMISMYTSNFYLLKRAR